ncbi:MAG: hypothetical protein M3Y54_16130 [Bacteroidota bacterium]|nr:hypothetical protein [Bacteroidota bacterium]
MPKRFAYHCFVLTSLAGGLLATGCVRQSFFQPDARPAGTPALTATTDSVRGATAGRHYAHHGRLYKALVGRHHRATWAAPVAVPVLRLDQARPGGLRPGKVGGGFNSTSLSLSGGDGQNYVIRTVDKDPIRAMPESLRGTFLVNALRDNISATNPYASLVVPPLARALGVPSSHPLLFYVRADDPAFQTDSLRHFRGQLGALEEKAAVAPDAPAPTAVLNSTKAFRRIYESPAFRLDQPALLRARLLDGWLGDWDRHPGQWSWAVLPPTAGYAPVAPLPKDRDMVFYRGDDGPLGWLVGHLLLPHWATFGPRYKNPRGLMSSGHYLDTRGLNQLTRTDFRMAALAMQQRLPDSLLLRALHRLPAAVFALEGPRTLAALQARRAALPALADIFYRQLARRSVVGGTEQAERFEIHRYADSTVVQIFSLAAGPGPALLYQRAFLKAETHWIQLEGLGGKDVFIVQQHGPKAEAQPRVRIFGGGGRDDFQGGPAAGVRFEQKRAPAHGAYDELPEE